MQLFITLLASTLIASIRTAPAPSSDSIPSSRGQCTGLALNYIRSVSNIQECLQHCNCMDQCNHYSYYQGEGPTHSDCYLYQECSSVRYDNVESQWNYGSRSSSSSPCPSSPIISKKYFFRASQSKWSPFQLVQTFNIDSTRDSITLL